jgi:hypothetical protein
VFGNDARYRLLKAKGLAEIAVHDTNDVVEILNSDGLIEVQRVAQLLKILRSGPFPEHLRYGIAGHDMNQQKNHREN